MPFRLSLDQNLFEGTFESVVSGGLLDNMPSHWPSYILWTSFIVVVCLRTQVQATWCDEGQNNVWICQPCTVFNGDLSLSVGNITFKELTYDGSIVRRTSWTINGEILEDSQHNPATPAYLLYLIFESVGADGCPVLQQRSDIVWCGFTGCVSVPLVWTLQTSKFNYLAYYDSEGLNAIAVWDASTGAWLQTLFTNRLSTYERSCTTIETVNPFVNTPAPPSTPQPCNSPTEPALEPVVKTPTEMPSASPLSQTPVVVPMDHQQPVSSPTVLPATPLYRPNTVTVIPPGSNSPGGSRTSNHRLRDGLMTLGILGAVAVVALAGVTIYKLRTGRTEATVLSEATGVHENPLYEPRYEVHENPLYRPE